MAAVQNNSVTQNIKDTVQNGEVRTSFFSLFLCRHTLTARNRIARLTR